MATAVTNVAGGFAPDPKHEAVKSDYSEIREQIRAIEACRTLVFISTFAAVGACLVATAGVVAPKAIAAADAAIPGDRTLHSGLTALGHPALALWMIIGLGFAILFLAIGILTTVLKAREINLRKGFLAAAEPYIFSGQPPQEYLGWERYFMLYVSKKELLEKAKILRIESKYSQYLLSNYSQPATGVSIKINSEKHLIGSLLATFATLSTVCYLFTYALLCLLIITSSAAFLKNRFSVDLEWSLTVMGASAVIAVLTFGLPWIVSTFRPSKRATIIERVPNLVMLCVILAVLTVCAYLLILQFNPLEDMARPATIAMGLFTFLPWGIATYLMIQAYHCKKGRYSFEKYMVMWDAIFKQGPSPSSLDGFISEISS